MEVVGYVVDVAWIVDYLQTTKEQKSGEKLALLSGNRET